jgi:Carboxypeptidase regulatory-like domain/TonB-dependent Receptor Plug Domain
MTMRRQLIWAVALVLATFGFANAQETTSGSITGEVVDAQGAPVPGATVTVASPQGPKTFVTDSNGRFFAPYLVPGKYAVRVELSGFSPVEQKNIEVRLGQRVELSGLTLKVGGLEEVVEVIGSAPVVDTSSTTAGGTLDSDNLTRLPVGRNFTATLYLVPGVSDSSGAGNANPSIAGGSGLENNYVVDGVNITETGFGGVGSYNSTYGSLGTGVTVDFIKETQVKTGGFEAEYGNATGGVVNVVTKSGSNAFNGAVFGYFRPGALEGTWDELQSPQGTVNTTERNEYDFGVSLGGPLMKDKLFFFATFNPQFNRRTFIAPEPSSGVVFPFRVLGEQERKRQSMSYAGKVTWQAASNHRFDISAFGDPSSGEMGLQRTATLRRVAYPGAAGTRAIDGGFSEIRYGGHSQTVRYDGIMSPNWLIEASIARSVSKFEEDAASNEPVITDVRPARGGVPTGTTGGLGTVDQNDGRNMQFQLKSTNIFNAAGNHQVRYGVAFEDIEFTRDTNWTGQPILLADGRTTLGGAPVQFRSGGGVDFYRATRGRLVPAGLTTQKYYNFFIQDTWQAGRLTIRPGVRYERQKLTGAEPGVNGAPNLCFENDTRPGEGNGTGTSIPCTFTWDDNWAPRIGATWDIGGNGRSKIYASYGRFYARIPNDLAARAMSADTGITRQDYRDAALTQPVANGTSFAGSTSHLVLTSDHAAIIDPESGSTYKDEIVGGVEFEVGKSMSLGVRYVRRDMGQILEDIGELPVAGYFLDECGDAVVDYFITNVNASTHAINCPMTAAFEDPDHKYQAFEFTANKSFSDNWSLMASYRYAKLEGNFEGFFRSDNGQSDPSISSLFDFPTNDPSYTAIGVPELGFRGDIRFQGSTLGSGLLPNDRPHQIKVYANYAFGALNTGVGFNWGSGRTLTALAGNTAYANGGEIPETIRGGGIRTIDGFLERADPDTQVDLHLDYTIKMNDSQHVTLIADVFNLLNNQNATDYDNWTEIAAGTLNPNFGQPSNGGNATTPSFAAPISLRLGARFEW